MKRVLVTGMSGVGKSSALDELRRRGYKSVDTDYGDLTVTTDDGETVWDEPAIQRLLSTEDADVLFVGGTAENMGRFRQQFDCVILLSAPANVMVQRLTTRTNNPYGRQPEQVATTLRYKDTVEPLLRRIATIEIDTTPNLDQVVTAMLEHVRPASTEGRQDPPGPVGTG
jgi:RNase adaptor protein for sRNA GlmZ degradation